MSEHHWIQTYTGRAFYLLDPRPNDVCIEDIAHGLSNLCRFAGQTRRFYSVAEHSYRVARLVPPEHKLTALLHDAAEAYIVDLPRPLKLALPNYRVIEQRVEAAIGKRFGIDLVTLPRAVKQADVTMLATERRDLMAPSPQPWVYGERVVTDPLPVVGLTPGEAEHLFLMCFDEKQREAG